MLTLAAMGSVLLTRSGDDGTGSATASTGSEHAVTTPAPVDTSPVTTPSETTTTVPEEPAPRTVSLAAVGDIVMGSPPYGLPADGGRGFFAPVASLLAADLTIGNLEGTLTSRGTSKCGAGSANCFAFRTPPDYARHFAFAGFDIMSVANNHANDFGEVGRADTIRALRARGIGHTGRPGQITVRGVNGIRVAVLGFAPYPWAQSLLDIAGARALVRDAAQRADVVIVTMHAGAEGSDRARVVPGPERYLGEPRGDVMAFSRAVVDAGADLVVGHGPHILRGMEFHRGRLIAYSMGNFGGYKVFNTRGDLSLSGVLRVTLDAQGRFVRGRLAATRLDSSGLPRAGGASVPFVRRRSQADFGASAARIAASGAIRAPVG